MGIVGRSKLDHPSLGDAGGSILHGKIEAIYEDISNHLGGRFKAYSGAANSSVVTYEHGFGVSFAELTVLLYTGAHPNLMRVSDLAAAGWTVTANQANATTQIDITCPAAGGPHTFAVFVVQGRVITPGSIANADLAAGAVKNANVASDAAIADSKLATISTAGKVSNSATTATNANIQGTIVARDTNGNFSAGTITATLNGNAATATSATGAANLTGSNLTGDVTNNGNAVTLSPISNAKIAANAAIDGAKINPDFGSQNVTTTGNIGGTNALITGYEELSQIAKPNTNPASGKVRVYAKSDSKLYKLDSNGNESAVGSGGGSSGVNYLVDWYDSTKAVGTVSTVAAGGNVTVSGSFPSVTSAWYADATSGAAAIAASTDNTLRGTTNYLTALSGASTSGATFVQSPVFNIDGEDLGKALTVQFDVSGNTTDDDWDVVAVRYNSSGTFQELIPIAGNVSTMTGTPSAKLPLGVKTFNGFFIPSSTASDVYAIRWRRRNGSVAIRLDSLVVGPNQVLQGAIVTDWTTVSSPTIPTGLGSGSGSWDYYRHRRVGGNLEIDANFRKDATAGTGATSVGFALPISGITLDTTNQANMGSVSVYLAGGLTGYRASTASAWTSTTWRVAKDGAGGLLVGSDMAANSQIGFKITIAITEWQSNTQQAARAVEEYAYNTDASSTGSITASGFANGPDGVAISSNWTAVGTTTYFRRVRFQTPILTTDTLSLELFDTSANQWTSAKEIFPRNVASTFSYGMWVEPTTTSTDVDVRFAIGGSTASGSTYGSSGSAWSTRTSYKWRVRKVSGGAAVGYPVGARNVIGDTTGTAVPAGYVGEKITFTTTSVTGGSGSWVANSTSMGSLTTGVWLVCMTGEPAPASACNHARWLMSTNSTNDGTGSIITCGTTYAANANAANQPMVFMQAVYVAAATTPLYAKGFGEDATVVINVSGYAVRIA